MHYELIITVRTNLDRESDPYNYTEVREINEINETHIKDAIKEVQRRFRSTLPFNINPNALLPTRVIVRELPQRRPRVRIPSLDPRAAESKSTF